MTFPNHSLLKEKVKCEMTQEKISPSSDSLQMTKVSARVWFEN